MNIICTLWAKEIFLISVFLHSHLNLLVGHWLADQKCHMKSVFFLAKKVVGCMTFGSHLTSQQC